MVRQRRGARRLGPHLILGQPGPMLPTCQLGHYATELGIGGQLSKQLVAFVHIDHLQYLGILSTAGKAQWPNVAPRAFATALILLFVLLLVIILRSHSKFDQLG